MFVAERVTTARRWIAARGPRTVLFTGWLLFVLGCYPGYLSVDAVLQLFSVRSGDVTDYSPVMTWVWIALETVFAGPFPMLLLQSGLFLFGLAAVLRTVLSPRAAAITAVALLLFPPIAAPLTAIWPDPLMAGAVLAAAGALLQPGRGWRITGLALLVLAAACRPELSLAVIPIALLATASRARGLALAAGVMVVALGASWALTVSPSYTWEARLMTPDVVGTLRRIKPAPDEPAIATALAGLPTVSDDQLRHNALLFHDAHDEWAVTHGRVRVLEPVTTSFTASALVADWRQLIAAHPRAYLQHRYSMTRALLALSGRWQPLFADFGSPLLTTPLHLRASPSAWEDMVQAIFGVFAHTPLFSPWLYVVLAVGAIALARRHAVIRNLAISGLVYELVLVFAAPVPEYRYSHWLVTTSCLALAAWAVARRPAWRRLPDETVAATGSAALQRLG